MNILLEEERINLKNTTMKLKGMIELALKLKSESDFNKKELELQNSIDKFTSILKERKHKQFVKDLTEFKENRAYLHLNRAGLRNIILRH